MRWIGRGGRGRPGQKVRLGLGLLAAVALWPALGSGQPQLPEASDEAEAPLPDVEEIERGARPKASVSFDRSGRPPAHGRRSEAADPSAEPGEPADEGTSVRRLQAPPAPQLGGQIGIYGLDAALAGEQAAASRSNLPEAHVVGRGETLSGVCERYFADPYCWPRLWSENPQVTNPHWIFPGDVLRLRPGKPAIGAPAAAPRSGPSFVSRRRAVETQSVILREAGFIDKGDLAESARLTGSREEKIMLASGDQAYIAFDKNKPLRAGERYSVFVADTQNPVKAPETGAVLGYLVRVFGDIVVDQITDKNIARGTLLDLVEPVERGFAVSPKVRLFKSIEPKPAAANLEARIVASFSPAIMLAAENFVVLSRGGKDGLAVGNRIFVVRRGDGYRPLMEGWAKPDLRFPKEVVAELWVMDVRDTAAVAWVARSNKELRIGEVAELRKGH
jgi:LysM domain